MTGPDPQRLEQELELLLRRTPVAHIATLNLLNNDEVQEGYRDGRDNFPCGENRSRSYWHGWRNGMIDGRNMESDWASRMLAASYVAASSGAKRPAPTPEQQQ